MIRAFSFFSALCHYHDHYLTARYLECAIMYTELPGLNLLSVCVCALPHRTTINYQYRFGTSTMVALTTLWKDGGIPRFYSGLGPALIQVRLDFGSTAKTERVTGTE